jgi:hypothetical protein
MGEVTHIVQRTADILWMIVFIIGGVAFAIETIRLGGGIMSLAYGSLAILLCSLGFFGRAYPDIEKDELSKPE